MAQDAVQISSEPMWAEVMFSTAVLGIAIDNNEEMIWTPQNYRLLKDLPNPLVIGKGSNGKRGQPIPPGHLGDGVGREGGQSWAEVHLHKEGVRAWMCPTLSPTSHRKSFQKEMWAPLWKCAPSITYTWHIKRKISSSHFQTLPAACVLGDSKASHFPSHHD